MAELGWGGVLVEPNPAVFAKLVENYKGFKNIKCIDYAIGKKNGTTFLLLLFFLGKGGVTTGGIISSW